MKQLKVKQSSTSAIPKNKVLLVVLFGPLLVFTLLYLTILSPKPCHYIYQNELRVRAYADTENKEGASEVQSAVLEDNKLIMDYSLRPGYFAPYAGVTMTTDTSINISWHNRLEVEASVNHEAQDGEVFLLFYEPAVKDQHHRLAARHLKTDITFSTNNHPVVLPLDQFETPDWWLDIFGWSRQTAPAPQWDQLQGVNFVIKDEATEGQMHQLTVKGVRFYRDNTADFIYYILFHAIIVIGYIVFRQYSIRKGKKLENVTIHYKATQTEQARNTEEGFMSFIHQNYDDADLTLAHIEKATGISSRTISAAIAQQFGVNFKTYLNQIRVVEARRLLTSTTLTISEVAYSTGFNSPASFNRVFKNMTGQTPSEYRKAFENK